MSIRHTSCNPLWSTYAQYVSNPISERDILGTNTRDGVRALEVLGKIGGLFDNKVTVTTQRSPEELEKELIEKLSEFFGDSVN